MTARPATTIVAPTPIRQSRSIFSTTPRGASHCNRQAIASAEYGITGGKIMNLARSRAAFVMIAPVFSEREPLSAAKDRLARQREAIRPIVSAGDIWDASLCRQGVINFPEKSVGTEEMTARPPRQRDTFRHGNLPEALLDAALVRLEADGAESISLRELASDAGVNHRAVYRHFPDKLSLLARVAERGWQQLAQRLKKSAARKAPGEPALVAASVEFFLFARDHANLFHLMGGARINTEGGFPDLEAAIIDALQVFAVGFAGTGMAPDIVIERTAIFVAALQGVVTQILHRRLHVAPAKAKSFVTDICRMLIKGIR